MQTLDNTGAPIKIDAHHHLWRYTPEEYGWIEDGMSVIRRDFGPQDLARELDRAGIAGAVAVQARQTLDETRWLLDLADQYPFLRGVVGWAPIAHDDFAAYLDEFSAHPKLRGLRHVIQGEPDPDYILREDFNRGIRAMETTGLAYDILILERQLSQTIAFVDRHPNQVFVLDHLAKPLIAAGVMEPWASRMRDLGRRENVYCKVSGMVTEADWVRHPHEPASLGLGPYLDVAVATFTPERLMVGSDWPVCLVGVEYAQWFGMLEHYFAGFNETERDAIFGGNAMQVYRL